MAIRTLRDLWERNARLHPNRLAVVGVSRELTHAQLLSRGCQLANALAAEGVRPGDRVAMLAMNCIEYLEVLVANHVLGSAANTLNFRLAGSELEWIVRDSSPRVLIFQTRYAETVAAMRDSLSSVDRYVAIGERAEVPDWAERYEDVLAQGSDALPEPAPEPEAIANLLYTSGTTGRPKGVMRSHRAEIFQAEGMACGIDVRPDSRILEVMPLFHLGAQASAYGIYWRAGTVYVHESFEPTAVLQAIEEHRLTHLHFVPLMIQDLLDCPALDRYDLSTVETLLYAAAPITPATLRRGIERLGDIFVGIWGMTEGSGSLLPKASHRPDGTPEEVALLSSVGQEQHCARIRIVDDDGNDCPPGTSGELWLETEILMSGYWNNTAATLEAMSDGWFHTGDVGYFDDARNIYLVDRKKDMIISGGENIYSQEVERAMAEHPDVDRVAVIGVPDERWGEAVKAIVVLRPGATASEVALIEHCGREIASYKKPRSVDFVDELPVLASGKVNKVTLRERFSASAVGHPEKGVAK